MVVGKRVVASVGQRSAKNAVGSSQGTKATTRRQSKAAKADLVDQSDKSFIDDMNGFPEAHLSTENTDDGFEIKNNDEEMKTSPQKQKIFKFEEKQELVQKFEAQIKALQDQLSNAKLVNEKQDQKFSAECSELMNLNKNLKLDIQSKEEELEKIKVYSQDLSLQINHMNDLNKNLEQSLKKSNEQLLELTDSNETLKQKVSEIISQSNKKDSDYDTLIKKYETDLEKLHDDIKKMEEKYQDLLEQSESKINLCNEAKNRAESEAKQMSKKFESAVADLNILNSKLKKNDSIDVINKNDNLENSITSNSISYNDSLARDITGSLVVNCQSISDLVCEKLQALQNCEILSKKLSESNSKLVLLQKEYEEKIPHYNDLKMKYDLSLKQITELNRKFTNLLFQFDKAKLKIATLEANNSNLETSDNNMNNSSNSNNKLNESNSQILYPQTNDSSISNIESLKYNKVEESQVIKALELELKKYKQILIDNNIEDSDKSSKFQIRTNNMSNTIVHEDFNKNYESSGISLINIGEMLHKINDQVQNFTRDHKECNTIDSKYESLNVVIAIKDRELLRREKECSILHEYISQLLKFLKDSQKKIFDLEKQITLLQIDVDDYQVKNKHLEIKINILAFIKDAAEAKNAEYSDKIYDNIAISKLVDKLNNTIITLATEKDMASKKVNNIDNIILAQSEILEKNKSFMEEKNHELKLKINNLEILNKELLMNEVILKQEIKEKESQLFKLEQNYNSEISKLKSDHEEIVQNFEKKITELSQINDSLECEEDQLVQKSDSYASMLKFIKNSIIQLKSHDFSITNIIEAKNCHSQLANVLESLKSSIEKLYHDSPSSDDKVQKLEMDSLILNFDSCLVKLKEFIDILNVYIAKKDLHLNTVITSIDKGYIDLSFSTINDVSSKDFTHGSKYSKEYHSIGNVNKYLIHLITTCIDDTFDETNISDDSDVQLESILNSLNNKIKSIKSMKNEIESMKNSAKTDEQMHNQLINTLSNLEEENNTLTTKLESYNQNKKHVHDKNDIKDHSNIFNIEKFTEIHVALASDINSSIQNLNNIEKNLGQIQKFGKLSDTLSSRLSEIITCLQSSISALISSHSHLLNQIPSLDDYQSSDTVQYNNDKNLHSNQNFPRSMMQSSDKLVDTTNSFIDDPNHKSKENADQDSIYTTENVNLDENSNDVLNVSTNSSIIHSNNEDDDVNQIEENTDIKKKQDIDDIESGELSDSNEDYSHEMTSVKNQSYPVNEALLSDFDDINHHDSSIRYNGSEVDHKNTGNLNLIKIPPFADYNKNMQNNQVNNDIVWKSATKR